MVQLSNIDPDKENLPRIKEIVNKISNRYLSFRIYNKFHYSILEKLLSNKKSKIYPNIKNTKILYKPKIINNMFNKKILYIDQLTFDKEKQIKFCFNNHE